MLQNPVVRGYEMLEKELKKLTTFQDQSSTRGGKPKEYARAVLCEGESWIYFSQLFIPFSNSYTTGYNATSDPLLTF